KSSGGTPPTYCRGRLEPCGSRPSIAALTRSVVRLSPHIGVGRSETHRPYRSLPRDGIRSAQPILPEPAKLPPSDADVISTWPIAHATPACHSGREDRTMARIKVRKGMPSVQLTKNELAKRIRERFYDPDFDKLT